jgi:hypothetical protein
MDIDWPSHRARSGLRVYKASFWNLLQSLALNQTIPTRIVTFLPPSMTVHPLFYKYHVQPTVQTLEEITGRHYWGDEIVTRSRKFMEACKSWAEEGKVEWETDILEGEAAEQEWEDQYEKLQQCLTNPDGTLPVDTSTATKFVALHETLRNDTLKSLAMSLNDVKARALGIFESKLDTLLATPGLKSQLPDLEEDSYILHAHLAQINGPPVRLYIQSDSYSPARILDAFDCLEHSAALSHLQQTSLQKVPQCFRGQAWHEAREASILLAHTTRMQLLDYQNMTHTTGNAPEIEIKDTSYTKIMRSYRQAMEGQDGRQSVEVLSD